MAKLPRLPTYTSFMYSSKICSFEKRCSSCIDTIVSASLRPHVLSVLEETPRHLHGQRAGALQVRFVAQVGPRRAQNAHGIETGVPEKSLVFRGENRVQERLRNVGVAHRPALFARTIKQIRDQLGLDVRARKLVAAAERPDGTDGLAGKLDL